MEETCFCDYQNNYMKDYFPYKWWHLLTCIHLKGGVVSLMNEDFQLLLGFIAQHSHVWREWQMLLCWMILSRGLMAIWHGCSYSVYSWAWIRRPFQFSGSVILMAKWKDL